VLTAKLQKEGAVVPFTLPPEAVAEKVLKALRTERPNTLLRYFPDVFIRLFKAAGQRGCWIGY
jgi:hypothetical protein